MHASNTNRRRPSLLSLIGIDVLTEDGKWLGVVDGVFQSGAHRRNTCVVLNSPRCGARSFALPMAALEHDPVQGCLVWHH